MTTEKSLFVSLDGNDSNPGTEAQPFATLARARDAVRAARPTGPISVFVRQGTYYLTEPLVFGPEDSGAADAPIRFQAYEGEKPTLSGALRLDLDWRPHKDGILKTKVRQSEISFDQLFVNGERKHRARYPSYDPEDPTQKGKGLVACGEQYGKPASELEFYPGAGGFNPTREWKRPEEAFLHVRWFYGTYIYQLRGMDYEKKRFLLGRGGWHWNSRIFAGEYLHFSRCFVDNVFEELDTPGEWYFDKQDGVLYYMPEEGEDMTTARVEVPQLRQLVEFRGTQNNPVRHIELSGFQLTHTTTVFMEEWEAVSMGDWAIHRSGAAFMEGTEECAVENCLFHATGGNAVFLNLYNLRSRVRGCTFTETGESAVCLVGFNMGRLGTARPFPDECIVHNNHMHHLGEYNTQVAGVFLACCQKTRVSHNDIHDVPRAAVLIHDPTWGGHIVEYNKLYDTCQDSVDHGPFNSWGRTRHWCYNQSHGPDYPSHPAGNVGEDALHTTVLRYNYMEDRNRNFGVDMDDGTCNYHIHHNLLLGCPIKFREGTDCLAENNIVIDSALGTRVDTAYEYNTNKFLRNIVVLREDMTLGENYGVSPDDARRHFYHAMQCPIEGPLLEKIDNNVFWSDLGEFKACITPGSDGKRSGGKTEVLSLEQWQARGYDCNSVFADPMFVDEENGDYRVRNGSPALERGFENFAMDKFGLLSDFVEW